MAMLRVPDRNLQLTDRSEIRRFLDERGIYYERWSTELGVAPDTADAAVLDAYGHWLKPFMAKHGYQTADVITVTPETPNLQAIREKFLREHTHSEDEVRFFVEGEGLFWFHKDGRAEEVFSVLCEKGDLISVPANTKHWFDLGPHPRVRAIRVFTDQAGWVPNYTNSGIEERYR